MGDWEPPLPTPAPWLLGDDLNSPGGRGGRGTGAFPEAAAAASVDFSAVQVNLSSTIKGRDKKGDKEKAYI